MNKDDVSDVELEAMSGGRGIGMMAALRAWGMIHKSANMVEAATPTINRLVGKDQ